MSLAFPHLELLDEGLPVTTVPRTILDVATAGLADELVEQAIHAALALGLALPVDLEAVARHGNRRVSQLICRALASAGQTFAK